MPPVLRNIEGYRIGATHHNAKHSDAIVLEVRNLREYRALRYAAILALFAARVPPVKLSYGTVRKWCNYERR